MATYTQALRNLTGALLNPEEMSTLEALLSPLPMDFIAFVKYDDLIGWASITRIESESYHVDDREVFRPLQYCGTYLSKMAEQQGEWLTRETVHMAGVHLETLVGRISLVHKIPLGQAIMKKLFKESVTPETWDHLDQFRIIFNAAKHDMTHTKDTHLFSYEDAVLAYVVCRKLGIALKPYCSFKTEWCL